MARGAWRLPGYKIEDLIGAGSSGEVWRATVTSSGVPVALKRIWLSERGQRQTALSEAAMLSTLDHPHLMKLHEVRPLEDAIVLVLDLAGAGSLATLLARRGRLTVGETITALAPIGAALAYAHNAGVVHGDVSSANILFTDVGLPLLADLGVARLLGEVDAVRTTPSYADPAVAAGGLPVPASDVFMLGAVALHALTGAPPWPGDEASEVLEIAATTGDEPDFAARLDAAGAPAAVVEIVSRALRLDPEDRCTAADFALELRHAADPVAVELTAGRARHAARTLESWPLESVPPRPASAHSAESSAETSAEPSAGSFSAAVRVPPFARQPLTYGVRAPTPFTQPPGLRHQARAVRARRIAVGAVAVAVMAVLVTAVVAWPRSPVPARVADGQSAPPSRPAPPTTPVRSGARSAAHSSAVGPAPVAPPATPASARAVLAVLDRARQAAYARRDPALLAGVYSSAVLLARDRAELLSAVPRGCGLTGLRTTFDQVRAEQRGIRMRVHARVHVRAASLVCGASHSERASARPVPMTIDLRRTADGFRIDAERRG